MKKDIKELFAEVKAKSKVIIDNASSMSAATNQLMDYVSSSVTSKSKVYVSTIYTELSNKTLEEPIFADFDNANKFYELNLRGLLLDKYDFDINSLKAYKDGLQYKEINDLYATAVSAVGGAGVAGILLGILAGVVKLPMVVVIAGAVLAGVGCGTYTHYSYVSNKNRENYYLSVKSFLRDLENEMLKWVDEVERYYNQQVNNLKKTL